jgi:hypothetical protein
MAAELGKGRSSAAGEDISKRKRADRARVGDDLEGFGVSPACWIRRGERVRAAPNPPHIWAGFEGSQTAQTYVLGSGVRLGALFCPSGVGPDIWDGVGVQLEML